MEIEKNIYIQFHRLCKIKHSKELLSGKEFAWQCRRHKSPGINPWVGKIPWITKEQHTPVFLSGESHGQRILVGYYGIARSQTEQLSNFWRLNMWSYQFFNYHNNSSLWLNQYCQSWIWTVLWGPISPSRTNTKKRCPFHHKGLECKSRNLEISGVTGKFGLCVLDEAGQELTEF